MLINHKPNFRELEERYAPLGDLAWNELEADEQMELMYSSFPDYSFRNLRIRPKTGPLCALRLNREQQYLHDIAERQLRETGKVRIILLKGRQWGGSTYIAGRGYHKATHRFGYRVSVIAHEQPASDELYGMVQRYHDNCNPMLKPETGMSNIKELRFSGLDGAGYEVATAGAKAPGRSKSFNFLHWSELGSTPNSDEHKAGLMQTIPEAPDTEIWLESTAKGQGGTFHQFWTDSVEGKTGYWAVFIPWFWHEEYRADVPQDFERTNEEQDLVEVYGIDDEQLMFRRRKIGQLRPSDGGNADDLFKQEYPCSWQEAFLFSGRNVFAVSDLVAAENKCQPGARQDISYNVQHKRVSLKPDKNGPLQIWVPPMKGHRYVIGADTAEGNIGGDFSCAYVIDVLDGSTVAVWHGHQPADEFGDTLYSMGLLYNKAQIAVETNFSDAVLFRLKHRRYPDIYQREMLDTETNRKQKKLGFKTTKQSKRSLVDFLDEDLRDAVPLRDINLLKEMSTFVVNDDMSMSASRGMHDDRVMSRGICSLVWRLHPKFRKSIKEATNKAEIAMLERQRGQGKRTAAAFFKSPQRSEGQSLYRGDVLHRSPRADPIKPKAKAEAGTTQSIIDRAVDKVFEKNNWDVPLAKTKKDSYESFSDQEIKPPPRRRQLGG